jgi:hypothetical protein
MLQLEFDDSDVVVVRSWKTERMIRSRLGFREGTTVNEIDEY